jgi:single-strand DNA-binding protein
MNKFLAIGNIVRDPEMRTSQAQKPVASLTIAITRKFKDKDGNKQVDFINCVAFGSQAEFIGKYLKRGNKISIIGSIQTRNYDDKDGKKVYVTEIVIDEIEGLEKREQTNNNDEVVTRTEGGFLTMDDDDDTSLPFNL